MDVLKTFVSFVLPPIGLLVELGSETSTGPELLITLFGSIPALFHVAGKISLLGMSDQRP